MLIAPSESLEASPKRSTLDTGRAAGLASDTGGQGDEASITIVVGVDTVLDGSATAGEARRRADDRDPERAARVASSEVSEESSILDSVEGGGVSSGFFGAADRAGLRMRTDLVARGDLPARDFLADGDFLAGLEDLAGGVPAGADDPADAADTALAPTSADDAERVETDRRFDGTEGGAEVAEEAEGS